MNGHHGRQGGPRASLIAPFHMTMSRILISAPLILFAVGCGAIQAVGDFPNQKDTVTVYTTPPQTSAVDIAATVP